MHSSLVRKRQEENEPQLPKIRCAFHSEEFLTNFCSSKACLLPLCPSCIKIHVNEHIAMKTNPQLENMNEMLKNLYNNIESFGHKFNLTHKRLVQIDINIDQMKEKLKKKFYETKIQLITQIQKHFITIQQEALQKISETNYMKKLLKFKDYTKKIIHSLKNTQRNFLLQQNKIMRMMIKYEGSSIFQKLNEFDKESQKFISFYHQDSYKLNINQQYIHNALSSLKSSINISAFEMNDTIDPKDISMLIKQLYEKPVQKKQIKKSIYKFLSSKNTPSKKIISPTNNSFSYNSSIGNSKLTDFTEILNHVNQMSLSQARPSFAQISTISLQDQPAENNATNYSSVKDHIVKATQDLNFTLNRYSNSQQNEVTIPKKRSLSKGKGITLMQNNQNFPDFKKHNNTFVRDQIDLSLINGRSENISRRIR